ncbi:hypothetical protein D3218_19185, partial [Aureimonas flava]
MSPFLTVGEIEHSLMTDPPRRRFVIPSLLPAGPGLLYGSSGSGKTGIAIRTAVVVAAGLRWADRETEAGSVLYVAGEDIYGAKERMVAAALSLGCDTSTLPLALMEAPAEGLGQNAARIAVLGAAQSLAKRTGIPIALIVIDTLAACFGPKSQDDATAASEYMGNVDRTARELSCAILSIHHTGKDTSAGMRGSQVFFDRADVVLRVKRSQETSFLTVEKMRNEAGGDRFAFDIASTMVPVSSGAISVQVVRGLRALERSTESAEEGKERKATTLRAQMLGILTQMATGGAADLGTWKAACYAAWPEKAEGTRKTLFHRNRSELQKEGLIRIEGQSVTVTVTGNSEVTPPVTSEAVTVTVTDPPSTEGAGGVVRTDTHGPLPENLTALSRRAQEVRGAVERPKGLSRG